MSQPDADAPLPPPESVTHDVIIIGGGMAGLSAAIYTTRERLGTLVLEKLMPGGQILTTARVENYPGFPEAVGGMELADRLSQQAAHFGARILNDAPVSRLAVAEEAGAPRLDVFVGDTRYRGRAVVLCVGSEYRKLDVPGEKRLTGYGVSYCSTCDAPFYRGKHVVIVGGGNTAVDEGLHLLQFAERVTYVVLGPEFTGTRIGVEELARQGTRVATRFESTVAEIVGKDRVEGVRVRSLKTGREEIVPCDGVFVFIGLVPMTGFLKGFVDLDPQGFIRTESCALRTSVPGVWAAGDVRSGTLKQAATAAGDGVVAALMVKEYLKRQDAAASTGA